MRKVGKTLHKSIKISKNNDNISNMKNTFQIIYQIYNDMYNIIISSNFEAQKLKQYYDNFEKEVENLKNIIKNILFKCKNSSDIQNNNIKPKESSQKISPNIKLFPKEPKKLYQNYAIQLETISSKVHKIQEDIKNISQKFEDDEKDIKKSNKFLVNVANIAAIANENSYELLNILLKEFYKTNNFNTIIYEKAKVQLSSWVNQNLETYSLENNISFFESYCKERAKEICNDIFFQTLYIDLCELFTLAILYSEKDIEITYIERGSIYQHDKMKDIKEIKRYVAFTVLPGLFVNNSPIEYGKSLVFCENNLNNVNREYLNIKIPKKNRLFLEGRIKNEDLEKSLKITLEFGKQNNCYFIMAKTNFKIPANDKPLYSWRYYINDKWNILAHVENNSVLFFQKLNISKEAAISCDIILNGKQIMCSECKFVFELLKTK